MWLFNLIKTTTNPLVRLAHGHTREIYLLVKKKKPEFAVSNKTTNAGPEIGKCLKKIAL